MGVILVAPVPGTMSQRSLLSDAYFISFPIVLFCLLSCCLGSFRPSTSVDVTYLPYPRDIESTCHPRRNSWSCIFVE